MSVRRVRVFDEAGVNFVTMMDSYKFSHWSMYEPETAYVCSYFEQRTGGEFDFSIPFGLTYILNRYFAGQVVTREKIEEADALARGHFGRDDVFNRAGWEYVLSEHGGRLPLLIRAVPEGMRVPESNVLFTVENTDPNCAWLVNHGETVMVEVWYPTTVCTISAVMKEVLYRALKRSADTTDKLPFMLHDFGYRGSTSVESASIGGAAHLVNFLGTDTIAALEMLRKHYPDADGGVAGFSVPAAEHSTITSWGEAREAESYRHILRRFGTGVVSVVSDSWDVYRACREIWGGELRAEVERGAVTGRTLVVRPDSGKPEVVVPDILDILGERFGSTINGKNYRVLPDYLRVIQGDGITRRSLGIIVEAVLRRGWSLENLVFGCGGGLLQDSGRDTLSMAMKCSARKTPGDRAWQPVSKSPATDPFKNSKRGYLYLSPSLTTTAVRVSNDVLRPVFLNGEVLVRDTLATIRGRAAEAGGFGSAPPSGAGRGE